MEKYDIIIIGAGAAGLGNIGVAHTIGLKALLIEKDKNNFGGDCTNYGCVPSKALIHIAHQFHAARQATNFGLQASGKADMEKVLSYIHQKQAVIKGEEDAEAMRSEGKEVLIGEASFVNKNTVQVNGQEYIAKLILLCTGSSPRKLDIEGMDQVPVYTNENIFFDCKKLPDNLVVIGGGAIGCELGQAFARLGSKVTIVNKGERLLDKEPKRVSEILEEQFKKEGISILNNTTIQKIDVEKAVLEAENGQKTSIDCDALLLAAGRVVNTKGLNLEKAGIELTDKKKIKTNEYLQTTNPNMYAIGDSAGSYMFSHGAEKMVRMLWRNLLIPFFKKKNTLNDLSWVTFTDPQVAHFGLTEEQLKEKGISYHRQDQSLETDDRAIIQEYTYGHQSIWMEDGGSINKRKILSGSLIAPNAGEIMQELELAKHTDTSIGTMTKRVYPYPVQTRINQKTLRGLTMKSFSDWQKKLARWAFNLFH